MVMVLKQNEQNILIILSGVCCSVKSFGKRIDWVTIPHPQGLSDDENRANILPFTLHSNTSSVEWSQSEKKTWSGLQFTPNRIFGKSNRASLEKTHYLWPLWLFASQDNRLGENKGLFSAGTWNSCYFGRLQGNLSAICFAISDIVFESAKIAYSSLQN